MTSTTLRGTIVPRTRNGARKRGVALLAVLSLTAFAAAQSLALFTSTTDASGNAFDNGSVIITTDKAATAAITLANMAAGDTARGSLVVTNGGTLPFRYAMDTTITDDQKLAGAPASLAACSTNCLSNQLVLTIKTVGTGCTAFDGVILYTNSLAAAFIGSNVQGSNPGDRTLAAGANETLCFSAHLPALSLATNKYPGGPVDTVETGNDFQLARTTATFTFDAEQTANNP